MEVRVRFAPSPTGLLHVGNARLALYNWLFARKEGGRFFLRIEDTDRERSFPEYEKAILEDLRWMGLEWDGMLRQSERLPIYQDYARRLLEEGKAYPCYCTPEELEEMRRRSLEAGLPPRYDGRCRHLTERERRRLSSEGRRPSVRFLVEGGKTAFHDLIFGEQAFGNEQLGDFVILRQDRTPTYNFACVIDDHLMGITHVIRGQDHLPNTPRQIMIYEALGFPLPQFAHIPLLTDREGKPLSKREGATTVRGLRQQGILPVALANYLVLLGGIEAKGEVMGWEEMREAFRLEGISRQGATFDLEKLLWLNRMHLRRMKGEEISRELSSLLGREVDGEKLELFRENVTTLLDFADFLPILEEEIPPMKEEARKLLEGSEAQEVVAVALRVVEEGVRPEGLLEAMKRRTGKGGRTLFLPLRAALTGRIDGPALGDILRRLDPPKVISRLKRALVPEEDGIKGI